MKTSRSMAASYFTHQTKPRTTWTPIDWALTATLATFGFFASSSVAAVYIAQAALLLLAIPLAPAIRRLAPWRSAAMATGLVLLAYIVLHSLWFSGFTRVTWHSINRYQELFFAPLLLAMMQLAPDRKVFYRALILGTSVMAALYWAGFWLPQMKMFLESRRISAGFAFAVCAFLLLLKSRTHARPWLLRGLAAFLALTILFATEGRTGYLVLVLLVTLAGWQSPRRWRWAACAVLPILVLTLAWSSTAVQTRLKETVTEANRGSEVTTTSTGIRFHMLHIAGQLVRAHPLMGVGFGNYGDAHREAVSALYAKDPIAYAQLPHTWTFTDNPHNEYLMQLLGGGIPALALFLAWLGITLREGARAHKPYGPLLSGICLAFALGCLFNSLLMDFVEGHLYMALLAWLLAEIADPGQPAPPALPRTE